MSLVLALLAAAAVDGGEPEPAVAPAPAAAPGATADQVDALEQRVEDLERALAETKAGLDAVKVKEKRAEATPLRVHAYLDFGFFAVMGDGSGVRPDYGRAYPAFADIPSSWALLGDPLATAINSRNEPADTGASRALTFDAIHSGGRPTFIVNAVNLNLFATFSTQFTAEVSVDFVPRDRNVSASDGNFGGDWLDVKLAYARYATSWDGIDLQLFAGKLDSMMGLEYRRQESPDRLGITPSLICRYTCGRPLGLAARAGFLEGRFELGLSLTNGSYQQDRFTFFDNLDSNRMKTLALKLDGRLPWGKGVEVSLSGMLGPQDRQPNDGVLQWQVDLAVLAEWSDFHLSAEFAAGQSTGRGDDSSGTLVPCGIAPCLDFRGAYGLFGWRLTNVLMPYLRVDYRYAVHRNGVQFGYFTNEVRGTVGLRADLHHHAILKAEYTHVHELEPYDFPDDVFTTSLVLPF